MKKKKILIADDDRHLRRSLRKRLKDWGYDVVESSDGLGVIAQATQAQVDALILDHQMPSGDGREIAYMIRQETDAPIILLTGHDKSNFRGLLEELHSVFYLSKPLESDRLRDILESSLIAEGREAICV